MFALKECDVTKKCYYIMTGISFRGWCQDIVGESLMHLDSVQKWCANTVKLRMKVVLFLDG